MTIPYLTCLFQFSWFPFSPFGSQNKLVNAVVTAATLFYIINPASSLGGSSHCLPRCRWPDACCMMLRENTNFNLVMDGWVGWMTSLLTWCNCMALCDPPPILFISASSRRQCKRWVWWWFASGSSASSFQQIRAPTTATIWFIDPISRWRG